MSETKKWIRTARCADIPWREGRSVQLGGRDIAIFNLGDRFLAVENRCPHKGGPLSDGIVAGDAVVCPLHAWKVHLETGEVARPANEVSCVETFRTRVEAGIILVALPVSRPLQAEVPAMPTECRGNPVSPHPSNCMNCQHNSSHEARS
jgi:nitrite reductase [NAD(P)H] small subunit